MDERIFELEDRVQDLELEVADLRRGLEQTKQRPAKRESGFPFWVLIPIIAIICGTIMSVFS